MRKSDQGLQYLKAAHNFATSVEMRPVQLVALDMLEMNDDQPIDVMAICPGGGKTIASIQKILEWVGSGKKVLILTHGTNVLKNQWTSVLSRFHIPFATHLGTSANIVISIPHALYRNLPDVLDFDHLVIDEAHEFYYAGMVQNTISRMKKGARVLALTGTPSVFIARKVVPIVISAVDVFNEGHLSNTYFGMVRGSQVIEDSDYNDEKEVKATYLEKDQELKSTVEKTIKTISKRIAKEVGIEGSSPVELFDRLEKTLIAARNSRQAEMIHASLKSRGVSALISTYKSDLDSNQMDSFLNGDEKVLIVVRRGILGFDMPELVCCIDFTGSRNINRIYQLYARVLRKHPNQKQKYFYRVCCANQHEKDVIHMKAALCLANADFISKFNGKNLSDMSIPVRRDRNPEDDIGRRRDGSGTFGSTQLEDEDLINDVREAIFANRVGKDSAGEAYTYVRFGDVMAKLEGKLFSTLDEKKNALIDWAINYENRPSAFSSIPEEKALALLLGRISAAKNKQHDAILLEKLVSMRPCWFNKGLSAKNNKNQLMNMAVAGDARPSQRTGSKEMKKLAKALQNYISPSNRAYDKEFHVAIVATRPDWFNQTSAIKNKLISLAKNGRTRPSQISKDPEERKLGKLLTSYTTKGSSFDGILTTKLRTLAPTWFSARNKMSDESMDLAA